MLQVKYINFYHALIFIQQRFHFKIEPVVSNNIQVIEIKFSFSFSSGGLQFPCAFPYHVTWFPTQFFFFLLHFQFHNLLHSTWNYWLHFRWVRCLLQITQLFPLISALKFQLLVCTTPPMTPFICCLNNAWNQQFKCKKMKENSKALTNAIRFTITLMQNSLQRCTTNKLMSKLSH